MSATTLIPDPQTLRLECIVCEAELVTLIVKTIRPLATCPTCGQASRRVHSRYERSVADSPWNGAAVRLRLRARKFFCTNDNCTRVIFTERLPRVVSRYARRSVRLNEALRLIGYIAGGEAGARLAAGLGYPFFVRQHYIDFLGREPEQAGFDAWLGVLNRCGTSNNPSCDRIEVSASFFRSREFQQKGFFVYRFYKVSLGRMPRYAEMVPDMVRVTAQTDAELPGELDTFTDEWVQRLEFKTTYDALSNAGYVNKLMQTAGVPFPGRDQLVGDLDRGAKTRAQVLRAIVESSEVFNKQYNEAFVAMQYFGYLRRDPEADGFNAWLQVINRNLGDYRTMVDGFVTSVEYRQRFGQP